MGELKKTLEARGNLGKYPHHFSSDNGPVLNDGYYDDSDIKNGDHNPWGPFRGGKYSLFEAGTHVLFSPIGRVKFNPVFPMPW